MDLCFLTATQLKELLDSDTTTVEQIAKSLLERIDSRGDAVRGWAYLNPELVLERARELDALPKEQRGPLHGLPVGVKDVIHTKGAIHLETSLTQICRHSTTLPYTRTITPKSMQVGVHVAHSLRSQHVYQP